MTTETTSNQPPAAGEAAHPPPPEIFSRFGTRITPLTKPDGAGYLKCIFHFEDGDSEREIHIAETRAEGGALAISQVLAGLPDFPVPPLPWPKDLAEARKVRRCYVCNCDTTERIFGGRRKPGKATCQLHGALLFADDSNKIEKFRNAAIARAKGGA